MSGTVRIPEVGKGSDNCVIAILPSPLSDYHNLLFYLIDAKCGKEEARYSLNAKDGYITEGVSVVDYELEGETHEAVEVQVRRSISKDFLDGIKTLQINEELVNADYEENQEHVISRTPILSYYKTK